MNAGRLLDPQSIAIVGISPNQRSPGIAALRNLERLGYPGTIHLVSRSNDAIEGRPCVPTIDALPTGVDAALLLIPQAAILDAVRSCVARKVGSAIVFAAGFAETGAAGRALQDEIAAVARAGDLALLGPNCLGVVNALDRVAMTFAAAAFDPRVAERPGVALVSQSGGTPGIVRTALANDGIAVPISVSTGNEAVLGMEDFVTALLGDTRLAVLGLVAEQVRSPQRFLEAARRATAAGRRIVLLHPGQSDAARESAASHTGALVGDHALARVLLEDAGVLAVDTIEEFIDVLRLAVRFPHFPASGPVIISDSGVFKGIALDVGERVGLPIPALGERATAALRAVLPEYVEAVNPVDLTAQALVDMNLYPNSVDAVIDDEATGSIQLSVILGSPESALNKTRALLPALERAKPVKPVVASLLVYDAPLSEELNATYVDAGIPLFRSPERSLRALSIVTRYGRRLRRPKAAVPRGAPLALGEEGVVPEYRAKDALRALGIAVPRGRLARTAAEAQAIAAEIGFPVVMKLQSAALPHKSDAGGVMLNLADAAAVADAWDRMHAAVRARAGAIAIDGVLVEEMAAPGIELIAGVRRDAEWGPAIVAGLGGIWAEALRDTVIVPPDADEAAIGEALRGLKAAPLFAGARGGAAVDLGAAARVLRLLGAAALATPRLLEIEINPLVLRADGALALDALIVTG